MKNYRLHIPEGVRDFLSDQAKQKDSIQNKIKKVFDCYGYNLIETPTFEYLDVFMLGQDNFQRGDLYKFVNRQGELVALRNDMTCAIARVVCTQNSTHSFPQRYAYVSNSFRYPERYQGKMHEFTQAGVELIGKNSPEADAEVIKVAISSLKEVGLEDFKLHISSAAFLECMLNEFGMTKEDKEKVYEAIENKDAVSLRKTLETASADKETLNMVLELMQCAGDLAFLRKTKEKVRCENTKKTLAYLEEVYAILEEYGEEKYILFDFSILSYAQYYTGIMFQFFIKGIGTALIEGGRYDKLLCQFGKDLPAVGFGINVNLLLLKLQQDKGIKDANSKRTLVAYEAAARSMALKVADELRKEDMVIENSLFDTLEEALSYAKQEQLGGILYFKENEEVEIYNIAEGKKDVTTISALLALRQSASYQD